MNVLLIDIGNTRIKWGVSQAQSFNLQSAQAFEHHADLSSLQQKLNEQWHDLPSPNSVMMSNVSDEQLALAVTSWVKQCWDLPVKALTAVKEMCGVVNGYAIPNTLGADRWAALLAAHSLHKKLTLIVNCGTAMTIDILQADGKHLGGYIMPGYQLMAKALHIQTHALPDVHDAASKNHALFPGVDTETAISNGIQLSLVAAIESALQQLVDSLSQDVTCLLTGGGAERILNLLRFHCDYQPHLVLRGLLLAHKAEV